MKDNLKETLRVKIADVLTDERLKMPLKIIELEAFIKELLKEKEEEHKRIIEEQEKVCFFLIESHVYDMKELEAKHKKELKDFKEEIEEALQYESWSSFIDEDLEKVYKKYLIN